MTFIQVNGTNYGVTFGERLRIARERLGLGQRELARLAGIKAQGQVQQYESGEIKEPSGSRTARLAAALKIRHEWLTLEEGEMEAPDGEAGPEQAPFDAARAMFLVGAADRAKARAWFDGMSFRLPSDANARQLLAEFERMYALHEYAQSVADAGGNVREVGLALGGVGSRIDDTPDDDGAPRKLAPVKRKPR